MKQLFIIFFSCALVACAGSTDDGNALSDDRGSRGEDCIFESSIRGYTVLDESNLVVSASGRRNYHVALARAARGLRSSWGIVFDSPTSRVCSGFSEVIFEGHFDGESIRIRSIRELSDEEHEDILIRFGKKTPEIEHGPAPKEVKGAEVEELDPDAGDPPGN